MIRRTPISPRVVAAVALFALGAWLSGPVAQRLLIACVDSKLGATLAIGSTSVSLLTSELELDSVVLMHPQEQSQALVSCERMLVDVEGSPLMRRKLVIRNATANGLRLHTAPLSTKDFAQRWPLPHHWKLQLPAQRTLRKVLSNAWAQAEAELLSETSTSDLLDVIADKGPREMRDLQDDLSIYELRLERLAELTDVLSGRAAEDTMAEEAVDAGQTLLEIQDLEAGLVAFRQRVETLRKDFQKDRQRLATVKEAEFARAKTAIELPLPEARDLSDYFLGAVAGERSWEIARYIKWARDYFASFPTSAPVTSGVGLQLAFPEKHPLPEMLVRALHFAGETEVASEMISFAGTLQNLTNDHEGCSQPMRLVIDAKAPHRVVVEALLEGRDQDARQRIVIRCPSWPQPAQTWGDPTQVAVLAGPSRLSLRAELVLSHDGIDGVVQMRQHHLRLSPSVVGELGGDRVETALDEMLGQVDTVDYRVEMHGPLESPALTLTSPLGEKVAGSLKHALEKELAFRASERIQRIASDLDHRIREWETICERTQTELQARLTNTLSQTHQLDTLVQQHLQNDTASRAALAPRNSLRDPAAAERK